MKKKLLTAVLSVVLCLGSAMTVMAAPSPTSQNTYQAQTGSVDTYVAAAPSEVKAAYESYQAATAAGDEQAYKSFIKAQTGADVDKVVTSGIVDVVRPNVSDAQLAKGIVVTFPAAGIRANSQVIVLHLNNQGVWEQLPVSAVGDGTISATFTSFSLVFYAEVETSVSEHYHQYSEFTTAPTAETWGYTTHYCECGDIYYDNYVAPTSQSAAAVTSPKTGESNMPMVVLFAAAAAAGAAVCVRRKVNA
ncbi:MAG: LPXTG cell wall anchor domain-containing protein [Roseburia sp.]|nr:LPXTG cell wall anchor domain-containing protein [Roseburia sp.]